MKYLPENWREIATLHYSTLALYGLLIVTCLALFAPAVFGVDLNPYVLGRWLLGLIVFALIGKFLVQHEEGKWVRRAVIGFALLVALWASAPALAAEAEPDWRYQNHDVIDIGTDSRSLSVAVDLIASWEGLRTTAYQDIVGVWTICYGHTETARAGQKRSAAHCRRLLRQDVADYHADLRPSFTEETVLRRLAPYPLRDAAFTSLAYNVGVSAAGGSTAVRRLNQDRVRGACEALTWWNRAGGRVVFGLVRRRTQEQQYCLVGL